MRYILLGLLLIMTTGSLFAEEASTPSEAPPLGPVAELKSLAEEPVSNSSVLPKTRSDTLSELPMVVLTLFGLICSIFVLAWFARRFTSLNFSKGADMKILSAVSLGARERVSLIEVGGKQFLIGVTPQQISHLHTFDESVSGQSERAQDKSGDSFAMKLKSVMQSSQSGSLDHNKPDADSKHSVTERPN